MHSSPYCAFPLCTVRACRQILYVTRQGQARSQATGARSRYLLGTEGCGHIGTVGGLYIVLSAPPGCGNTAVPPIQRPLLQIPVLLGRNYLLSRPQQGAHGWQIGQPLCLLWRVPSSWTLTPPPVTHRQSREVCPDLECSTLPSTFRWWVPFPAATQASGSPPLLLPSTQAPSQGSHAFQQLKEHRALPVQLSVPEPGCWVALWVGQLGTSPAGVSGSPLF